MLEWTQKIDLLFFVKNVWPEIPRRKVKKTDFPKIKIEEWPVVLTEVESRALIFADYNWQIGFAQKMSARKNFKNLM